MFSLRSVSLFRDNAGEWALHFMDTIFSSYTRCVGLLRSPVVAFSECSSFAESSGILREYVLAVRLRFLGVRVNSDPRKTCLIHASTV
jgi:hypothetical protein